MVTLARIDVLPDDGPLRPKHVGVINFNVLICVKKNLSVKNVRTKIH